MTDTDAQGRISGDRRMEEDDSMPAGDEGAGLGMMPQWDLSIFYDSASDPRIEADLAALKADARAFQTRCQGRLAALAARKTDEFGDAIAQYEALIDRKGRIGSFTMLHYAQDTGSAERRKFYGDMSDRLVDIRRHLIFFELELNRIDDDLIARAAGRGGAARYAPWLEDIRRERPHQLEDRLENLFQEKALTSCHAWNRLYDETISSFRFSVRGKTLALEPTLNLLMDANRDTRKLAAEALAEKFTEHLPLFTHITNTLAKDKEISDRWRNFADVAASRHLGNRVEPEVVDALVDAVRSSYPRLSHRYYQLKARWLGLGHLTHYDRNAPLSKTPPKPVPFEAARDLVLDAYRKFSPRMADIAAGFFDDNRIDAPARPGKMPGAFSHPTTPSAKPFVLLNYLGRQRDVMTLAHELGHGVHQTLAGPNGALMAPTPLTLAETASVFGEMLTFRDLLARAETPEAARILRAEKVEDMLNTVARQISFYLFERQVHERRRKGELTATELGEIWLDVQGACLGPAVRPGPGYETFWVYIGHFIHAPFYVYAYAFGDCLVNSLYAAFLEEGDGFAGRYLALLEAGGSRHYGELLAPFGLDARAPEFWQKGLNMIGELIDSLEETG